MPFNAGHKILNVNRTGKSTAQTISPNDVFFQGAALFCVILYSLKTLEKMSDQIAVLEQQKQLIERLKRESLQRFIIRHIYQTIRFAPRINNLKDRMKLSSNSTSHSSTKSAKY